MIQTIIIGVLFLVAMLYLVNVVRKSLAKKEACDGCEGGCSDILKKLDEQ